MNTATLRQTTINECGLVAVAVAAGQLGALYTLTNLRARFPISSRGTSLGELADISEALSLAATLMSCPTQDVEKLHTPAILHWKNGHFVVLLEVKRGRYRIHDPVSGEREIDKQELQRRFSGAAMELRRSEGFRRTRPKPRFRIRDLYRIDRRIAGAFVQALLLTALIQVHIVLAPLFIRIVLDDVVVGVRDGSIIVIAIAFASLALFNVIVEVLRSIVLIRVAGAISLDSTRRMFTHLLSLPLAWFQRRKLADVISRFDAIEPINTAVTNGLATLGLDAIVSIVLLTLMSITSPQLALIAVCSLGLYLAIRLATLPLSLKLDAQSWTASVAEQGVRIETLRAIQSIKAAGWEGARARTWGGVLTRRITAVQNSRLLQGVLQNAQAVVSTLSYICLVMVAVGQVWAAQISLGTLFAFLAYSSQFAMRGKSIVDQAIQLRMMGLYAERISEVVESDTEQRKSLEHLRRTLTGHIRGSGISFQYGLGDPLVLDRVNFEISPGEKVGIVGPSGGGKSTLVKIIAGLYVPRVGVLDIDAEPIQKWDYQSLRSQIGMVLQGDELLSGTIAENVCFFDPTLDEQRVRECLGLASLAADIAVLPLGIHTPVGDLGSNLSGGQRQRVLIARALYRNPTILILDEATSNLDVTTEQTIIANLIKNHRTLVVVSHRPETMKSMDRILIVQEGKISEQN